MYSWIFGRRRKSNAYFSDSLVTESNKIVFGNRFQQIQHLHKDCSSRGLNTIALPDQGMDSVGIHRSSMPCTPAATPAWRYNLNQAKQFTEETFRDRLLVPRKGKRRALVVDNKTDNTESMSSVMSDGKSTSGPSKKSFDDPKDRKVFVGNISFRVSKKSLWEFFTKFGVVVDCHLVIDHFKRKSKGIGFVTFKSVEAANRAKEAPAEELVLDQREMRVLACESRKRSLERPELSKTSRECESSSEDEGGLRHQSSSDSVASATIMEEGYFNIKELNDDVLMIVFSKLCIRNRLKVERVCKRWRTLAIKSWKLCQSLHFANVFTLNSGSCLTNEILRRILQRCHHLKKLDLSTASHHLDHRAVVIIARHCPLIYHVNLSGVPTTNADIQQLASKCPNLKEVLVRKNLELGERGLWSLFNQCKQLVEIDISGNSRATGKCFHMLGPELKVARLEECRRILPISFSKLALRCSKLNYLHMGNCRLLNDRSLKDICCNLRRLTSLNLTGSFPDLTSSGLIWLGELSQLEDFSASQNNLVDDLVLQVVCEGCTKLRSIDVSSCNEGITDLGLKAISQLSDLRQLDISYLGKITDSGLEEIAKKGMLEKLVARGSIALTDHVFTTIATLCVDLLKMDVSGCDNITNATINGCLEALTIRDNDTKLEIIVGGTLCTENDIEIQDDRLDISWFNRCVKCLRPDRADYIGLSLDSDYAEITSDFSSDPAGCASDDSTRDFLDNDDPMSQFDHELGDSPY